MEGMGTRCGSGGAWGLGVGVEGMGTRGSGGHGN